MLWASIGTKNCTTATAPKPQNHANKNKMDSSKNSGTFGAVAVVQFLVQIQCYAHLTAGSHHSRIMLHLKQRVPGAAHRRCHKRLDAAYQKWEAVSRNQELYAPKAPQNKKDKRELKWPNTPT
eukprot:1794881-Amphidinium_carterae.2